MSTALRVTDLAKSYGGKRAVDGISFDVRAGEESERLTHDIILKRPGSCCWCRCWCRCWPSGPVACARSRSIATRDASA